jgi:hypothetical protein
VSPVFDPVFEQVLEPDFGSFTLESVLDPVFEPLVDPVFGPELLSLDLSSRDDPVFESFDFESVDESCIEILDKVKVPPCLRTSITS